MASCLTVPDVTPFLAGLSSLLPRERLTFLLDAAGRREKRRRRLPADGVVWLLIARGLFAAHSLAHVWRKLHPSDDRRGPTDSAFHQARDRLGVHAVRQVWRDVVRPLAEPTTPGGFYRGWRLIGLDGTTVDVPDSPANGQVFGYADNQHSRGAFPQLRVAALFELGTHVILDVALGRYRASEITLAGQLVSRLPERALVIADRGLASFALIWGIRQRRGHFLGRVKATQRALPVLHRLADGSYLSRIYPSFNARRADRGGITVRVITYTHDDPNRPGCGEVTRLITTLLNPRTLPIRDAIALYHERWEAESTLDELKTHLLDRQPLLWSRVPRLVVQELYGVLLAHFLLRWLMARAARAANIDPDRLSFVHTLRVLECRLPEAPRQPPAAWLAGLLREIARTRLRPRRARHYPRWRKAVLSRWPKKPASASPPPKPKPFEPRILIT